MAWSVAFHPAFAEEFAALDETMRIDVLATSDLLKTAGPLLKRPHADTLKGSRHANMKELRFESEGGEWRLAYAFDPQRTAILLVAADKAGVAKRQFYKTLHPKGR
jgi:hypothetical protein